MRTIMMNLVALAMAAVMTPQAAAAEPAEEGAGKFAHMVFFSLAEPSAANRERLIAACQKYLSGHEGEMHFFIGSRAAEKQREVNVSDFDVSLHIVFENVAAHDRYQQHPRHVQFVEENSSLWNRVRVFDSYVD